MKPELSYDITGSHEEWRAEAYAKFSELLGLPIEKSDPDYEIEPGIETGFFTSYILKIQTEPGQFIRAYFIIPKNVPFPAPLTVCLCDHEAGMRILAGDAKTSAEEDFIFCWRDRAAGLRAIKEKRCALIPEMRYFGENGIEDITAKCSDASKEAVLRGRCAVGERIHDTMCAIDVIEKHFSVFVDTSDIVATGNAEGGELAYYLACIDKRISAVLSSCSISEFVDYETAGTRCYCNVIPDIKRYFTMSDLSGLIVPRIISIAAGLQDKTVSIDEIQNSYENIKSIYEQRNSRDKCAFSIVGKGHLNFADQLWYTYYKMK